MNDRLRLEYLYEDNSTYTDDIFHISNEELEEPIYGEVPIDFTEIITGFIIGFFLTIILK